jgi:20S proteasome alpha/beta subunit
VLAAERKVTSKLLEQDTSAEKLYTLNEYPPLPSPQLDLV